MTGWQVVDTKVTDLRVGGSAARARSPAGQGFSSADADPSTQDMGSGGLETNARKLATCTTATTAPITTAVRVALVESVVALERLCRA